MWDVSLDAGEQDKNMSKPRMPFNECFSSINSYLSVYLININ